MTSSQPRDQLREKLLKRIDAWAESLIDLSRRNSLISFKPPKALSPWVEAPGIEELFDPEGKPWTIWLRPPEKDELEESDSLRFQERDLLPYGSKKPGKRDLVLSEEDPLKTYRSVERLASSARSDLDNKGIRTLYLAIGFLRWRDPRSQEWIESPLVLAPIAIARESPRKPHKITFVDDANVVVNPALSLRLQEDLGLDLGADWEWEDKPLSQELDEIEAALESLPDAQVIRKAAIGRFMFHKLAIYEDLKNNRERIADHWMVKALETGQIERESGETIPSIPSESELDRVDLPELSMSVLDADASQRRCIIGARNGASLVIQGPPGTGKSQTIANIIAEIIATGRSVLFVSEKLAALEVVQKRLDEAGLGDYLLPLHGTSASRKEIVESLDRSVRFMASAGRDMNGTDRAALTERRTELNEIAEAIHEPRPLLGDKSVFQANAEIAKHHEALTVSRSTPTGQLTEGTEAISELMALRATVSNLVAAWRLRIDPSFAWRGLKSTSATVALEEHLAELVAGASSALDELTSASERTARELGLDAPASIKESQELLAAIRLGASAPKIPDQWFSAETLNRAANELPDAQRKYEDLQESTSAVTSAFRGDYDALPPGIGHEWGSATSEIVDRLGDNEPIRSHLIPQMVALDNAAQQLPQKFRDLDDAIQHLSAELGNPGANLSLAEANQLTEFFESLEDSNDRPLEGWLDEKALSKVVDVRDALRARIGDYEAKRDAALDGWNEAALDIPAKELASRFSNQHSGVFKIANSQYRADIKQIKSARKDGKTPQDIPGELLKLVEAIDARDACRSIQDSDRLGGYFAGEETKIPSLDQAIGICQQALPWLGSGTDVRAFSTTVADTSGLAPEMLQQLRILRNLWRETEQLIEPCEELLSSIMTRATEQTGSEVAQRIEALAPLIARTARLERDLRDARGSQEASLATSREQADLVDHLRQLEKETNAVAGGWRSCFGEAFAGVETNWDELTATLLFASEYPIALASLPSSVRELLTRSSTSRRWPDPTSLEDGLERYRSATEALLDEFSDPASTTFELNGKFESAGEGLRLLKNGLPALREWVVGQAAAQDLEDQGWAEAVSSLEENQVTAADVAAAFEKAFWIGRLDDVVNRDRRLKGLAGSKHEQIVAEFRRLDRELIKTGRSRVVAGVNVHHPGRLSLDGSETRIIEREARKKRRFIPPRKLIAAIPTVLPRLKPCLMMSPLNVSQYLTADMHFDVVIFDEASQVRTQDAINAIYRCEQVIIAGDNKQLPPSNFWETTQDDGGEEDEDEIQEDLESLLDEAEVALNNSGGVMTLRWHYRSRHQDLIAFSNDRWYQNNLLVFASPARDQSVVLRHVSDGVYDRGKAKTNPIEAEAVVDRLLEAVRSGNTSVGVVAFNSQQANLIQDLLSQRQARDPGLDKYISQDRLDGVFVKNLENVQGDERDLILLSLGYGRDKQGRFTMNFGPLNSDGGPRRLNVAISRARERVEVFASVQPEDFGADLSSPGPSVLRNYLAFARDGVEALANQPVLTGDDTESPFEESVLGAIESLGYQAVPQVGVGGYRVDLGVVHPGQPSRYVLGVECDGATYHSSMVARDRDRLREEQLRRLGWKLHRIWSTDWIYNRDREVEKLQAAIDDAIAKVPGPDFQDDAESEEELAELADEEIDVPEAVEVDDGWSSMNWVTTYALADLSGRKPKSDFRDGDSFSARKSALKKIVKDEGPITRTLATQRLARHWGLKSVGKRVQEAADLTISALKSTGAIEERNKALWLPEHELKTVRVPDVGVPETDRDLARDEIPRDEIDLAIEFLADGNGLRGEELVQGVARVFGNKRTGNKIRQKVMRRVKALDHWA